MPDVILITGASSGIGLEAAIYLAQRNLRVVATMRDPGKSAELDRAAAKAGVQVQVIALDVTKPESIAGAIQKIIDEHGRIDALINNAGIQVRGYFEDLSDEEIRRVFETNVFGTMAVTRAVLPHMRAAGRGRVAIVTSVGGRIGSPGLSAYCASKFAMEGFGEALALELALVGIPVSLIEPGIINTEIWNGNKLVASGATPESPYAGYFAESERMADWAVRTSPIRALHVARAAYHAVTAERPKRRYLIGSRPAMLLLLRRLLPSEVFERIYTGVLASRIARVRS